MMFWSIIIIALVALAIGDVFFPAGIVLKYLFEEARYCFAYGQFLATIMLGMAFIEQCLAAKFYASGRNDLERVDASTLVEEAFQQRLISQPQYEVLHRIRHPQSANSFQKAIAQQES
jgi:hypothetical protein